MLLLFIVRIFSVGNMEEYISNMEDYGSLVYYKCHVEFLPLDYSSNIARIHREIATKMQEKLVTHAEYDEWDVYAGDLGDFLDFNFYREVKKYVQEEYLDDMHKKLFRESFAWSENVKISKIKNKALMLIAANRLGLNKLKKMILESVKMERKNGEIKIYVGMKDNGNPFYREFIEFYFLLNKYAENLDESLKEVIEVKIKTFVGEGCNGIKLSITNAFKQFVLDLKPERRYEIASRLQEKFKIVDSTNLKYFIEEEIVNVVNNWYSKLWKDPNNWCGLFEDPFEDFEWTRGIINSLLDNSCLNILISIPKEHLEGYLLHTYDLVLQDILSKKSELLDIISVHNLEALKVFLLKNEEYNGDKKILEWVILKKNVEILEVFLNTTLVKEVDVRFLDNLGASKRIYVGRMLRDRNIDIKTDNLKDIDFIKKYNAGNKLIVNRVDFEYIEYCIKNSSYEYMENIYVSIEDAKLLDDYLFDNHYDFYIRFLCYARRMEEVKELISENHRLPDGSLYFAIKEGNLEMIKLLAENGFEVEDSDILELSEHMKPEILEYLLSKSKNYDIKKLDGMWIQGLSPECMEVLMKNDIFPEKYFIRQIFKNVTVVVLKKLEDQGYEWNNDCFDYLHYHGTSDVFEYLLNAGFKPRDYNIYALRTEVLAKVLPLLYEKGFYKGGKEDKPDASVGLINSRVADKLCGGSLESVKYLAERNIHPTEEGLTYTLQDGNLEIMEYLLEKGYKTVYVNNEGGKGILRYIMLLDKASATISDEFMVCAFKREDFELIKYLKGLGIKITDKCINSFSFDDIFIIKYLMEEKIDLKKCWKVKEL